MSVTEISGKTFLITGGASGLGALYAKNFLFEGAKKVAIADINESLGQETAAVLNSSYPGKVIFVKCDVGKEEEVAATFDKVLAEFGQLDVMINNAGIMSDSPSMWRKACDVNWQGLVSFTMKSQKHMRKDQGGAGGTIINVSSTAALIYFKELPVYAGSKLAVLHFSMSLAEDPFFEETGVRILTIIPGPTATPLLHGLKDRSYHEKMGDALEKFHEEGLAGREDQRPESVAAVVIKMFKEGANGSAWLAAWDRPAEDITPKLKQSFNEFFPLVF